MKWLEVIYLRSAEQNSALLNAFLGQLVEDIRKEGGAPKIKLFKRVNCKSQRPSVQFALSDRLPLSRLF